MTSGKECLGDHERHISSVLLSIYEANPEIESFYAVEYVTPLLLQDKIPNIEQTELFVQAAKLRQETKLPFWDSALTQMLLGDVDAQNILSAALYHNDQPVITHKIEAIKAEDDLKKLMLNTSRDTTLAVSSKTLGKDGKEKHIPMLDFHIPSNTKTYHIVQECLRLLASGRFIIVHSGKSFHAYGLKLINKEQLQSFLFRALLLNPVVDSRYIAHQLIDDSCKLRVAPSTRKPTQPKVIGTT